MDYTLSEQHWSLLYHFVSDYLNYFRSQAIYITHLVEFEAVKAFTLQQLQ
jgi:hypothetical protein